MTATQTKYQFACEDVKLNLTFTSPLIASNLDLMSRPISYVDFEIKSTDGKTHDTQITFGLAADIARNESNQVIETSAGSKGTLKYLKTGVKDQTILGRKGDDVRIDWGYGYLASMNPAHTLSIKSLADLINLGEGNSNEKMLQIPTYF